MSSNSQITPFDLKIQYLINSSIFLSDKVPQVSQFLMRTAVCYLKDVKQELHEYNLICKDCGAVLIPGFNVKIRCVKTTSKDRKKLFNKYMKNKKTENSKRMYYKNKMVYQCGVCSSRSSTPGVLKNRKVVNNK